MPNNAEAKTKRLDSARRRLLTHMMDNVDRDFISRVKVAGFEVTDKKIDYAIAYVSAPPDTDNATILKTAGVDGASLRRWRRRPEFNQWMHDVSLACTGTCVALVWRMFGELAADGNVQAGKMVLQRFDSKWRDILRKDSTPPPGPTVSPADLEATRKGLRTSEDEPIEADATVRDTGAGDVTPTPSTQGTEPEAEGGGGGVGPPIQ